MTPGASDTAVFAAAPGITGVTPDRLLDTRSGIGAPAAKVEPGASIDLQITGRGGIPASGVTAVALNVTAAEPTATSYLTVWPTGDTRPNASYLNHVAGQTVPNLVIVKVGTAGRVSLYNADGTAHLLADVSGWWGAGAEFTPITPARLLDTRNGTGGVTGPSSGTVDVVVSERASVPQERRQS